MATPQKAILVGKNWCAHCGARLGKVTYHIKEAKEAAFCSENCGIEGMIAARNTFTIELPASHGTTVGKK